MRRTFLRQVIMESAFVDFLDRAVKDRDPVAVQMYGRPSDLAAAIRHLDWQRGRLRDRHTARLVCGLPPH